MKKNLFYLFAFICVVSMFTACSDDDDNGWQELPKGDIKAENVDLTLNGATTTGTVSFTATGNNTAEVGLKNVIDGFSDLTVDVTMEKQADGSFKFNGTKDIATKPVTRTANTPAPYLKVAVAGTIDADGKAVMTLSATGPGLYIGTYSDETLVLTYGDAPVVGKTVRLDASTGEDASILLMDVIPGETETTLTGISFSDAGFSGSAQTSSKATVEYSGSRKDKVLTLNLKVKMADAKGWAKTYKVAEMKPGDVIATSFIPGMGFNVDTPKKSFVSSPCYAFATLSIPASINPALMVDYLMAADVQQFSFRFRQALGAMLLQVLNAVTLESDGNITAKFSSDKTTFDSSWLTQVASVPSADVISSFMEGRKWEQSPKNLAYWFEKDGKLYVKLNVSAIVAQATSGTMGNLIAGVIDKVLSADLATIKGLIAEFSNMEGMGMLKIVAALSDDTLGMVLDWVKNGVPLNVEVKDGHTAIYLDKTVLDKLVAEFPTIAPFIGELNPGGMGSMIVPMLTGFNTGWKYADEYRIGLDLIAQ